MPLERRRRPGALKHLTWFLALVLVASAFGAPGPAPADDLLPNLLTSFRARITPNRLPAHQPAPIALTLAEKVWSRDGSHPPALQELEVGFDRRLALSVKGLPVCVSQASRQPREEILTRCEDARVGSGTMEVEVAFPEQQPVRTSGRVSVYNGGFSRGRTKLWVYVLLPAPITGAILMPMKFRPVSNGRYALEGSLELPKIANGAASLTSLELSLRKGLFSASCPGGTIQTHATSRFADGSDLSVATIHTCGTAPAHRS